MQRLPALNMFIKRDTILAVREMMDRHFTVSDMAAKLNISMEVVHQAIDVIQDLLT